MLKKEGHAGTPQGKPPGKPGAAKPQTAKHQPQTAAVREHKTKQDMESTAVKKPEPQQETTLAAAKTGPEQETQTIAVKESRPQEPVQIPLMGKPLAPRQLEPGAAPGLTSPAFPCLCPDEKYPITRSVCLGRQERNYEKCLGCEHLIKERRPRKSDFKER
jgi:hypothetical protein